MIVLKIIFSKIKICNELMNLSEWNYSVEKTKSTSQKKKIINNVKLNNENNLLHRSNWNKLCTDNVEVMSLVKLCFVCKKTWFTFSLKTWFLIVKLWTIVIYDLTPAITFLWWGGGVLLIEFWIDKLVKVIQPKKRTVDLNRQYLIVVGLDYIREKLDSIWISQFLFCTARGVGSGNLL